MDGIHRRLRVFEAEIAAESRNSKLTYSFTLAEPEEEGRSLDCLRRRYRDLKSAKLWNCPKHWPPSSTCTSAAVFDKYGGGCATLYAPAGHELPRGPG